MNKKKISVLVATALITAAVNIPVHAQDGDVYNISNTTAIDKGSISNIILKDKATLLDMISHMQNYDYEISGKLYKLTDVNNQLSKNPSETIAQLQSNVKANLTAINNAPSTTSAAINNDSSAVLLDKFTLMAPSSPVFAGDNNVIIPFTAVDQNGTPLTKYSDIVGDPANPNLTLSSSFPAGALQITQNPDGTAALLLNVSPSAVQAPLTSQSYTIQAVTRSSGKFSSLDIEVQVEIPNTLTVTNTVAVPNMESGSVQNLGFGTNFADLSVKDQSGRTMDMANQDTKTLGRPCYYVLANAPAGSSVTVNPKANKAYGANNIQLQATGAQGSGSTTITYTVMKHINGMPSSADVPVSALKPVTQQYTVVNTADIKSYTMGTIGPLYDVAANTSGSSITAGITTKQQYIGSANLSEFENKANIYGLTSGGAKVALANNDIIGATVDEPSNFIADTSVNVNGTAQVGVYAKNTLNSTRPTATGTLAAIVRSADGLVHTVSTSLTAKDDTPVVSEVGLNVDRTVNTQSQVDVSGDNVTMSVSDFYNYVNGHIITKYNLDGSAKTSSLVYLYAKDQYGSESIPFTTLAVSGVDQSGNYMTGFAMDSNGNLSAPKGLTAGTTISFYGVTSNGLVQCVNIRLK